jgi:hypothetical protein
MSSDSKPEQKTENAPPTQPVRRAASPLRIRLSLVLTLSGFLVFLLGALPGLYGLDRSPIIGFVQIAVFLVGLAIICLGGYFCMMALWVGRTRSIAADIGMRLVSTGYVIAVFAGMADIFGFGSHPLSTMPYFGPWQARGVQVAETIIALGFLLMIPFGHAEAKPDTDQSKIELSL